MKKMNIEPGFFQWSDSLLLSICKLVHIEIDKTLLAYLHIKLHIIFIYVCYLVKIQGDICRLKILLGLPVVSCPKIIGNYAC